MSAWDAAEVAVSTWISARIQPHVDLSRDIEQVAYDMVSDVTKRERGGALLVVHHTLISRVLHDLRVAAYAARMGYTMQAWTVASSAYEAGYMMGFIGADKARAERWLKHKDAKNPVVSAYHSVLATVTYLGIAEPGEDSRTFVDAEYRFYQHLCLAKHVNPIAEKTRYVGRRNGKPELIVTPFYTKERALEAVQGLTLGLRAATTALLVLHRVYFHDFDAFSARVSEMQERFDKLLPSAGTSGLDAVTGDDGDAEV